MKDRVVEMPEGEDSVRPQWRLAAIAVLAIAASIEMAHAEGAAEVSLTAGERDAAGAFVGGTELRNLVPCHGRLYAGNGYWEDRPGEEGRQGAQILVLDGVHARWRVDHGFDDWISGGRRRNLAISALACITLRTDGTGTTLREPVTMLLASAWDLTGATQVFSRDERTGGWSVVPLARDSPQPKFLPQIRSFAAHRDRVTGIDRVFAGQDPRGIFSGVFDPQMPGRIR